MDIAALSMNLASSKLEMAVGISMTKKAMEAQELEAQELFKMVDQSVPQPPSDHVIDMKV